MKRGLQQFGVTNQYWITMYIVSIEEVRQEKKESIEVMSRQFRIWCVLLFFGRFGENNLFMGKFQDFLEKDSVSDFSNKVGDMSGFNLVHFRVWIILLNILLVISVMGVCFSIYDIILMGLYGGVSETLYLLLIPSVLLVYVFWVQIKFIRLVIYLKNKL